MDFSVVLYFPLVHHIWINKEEEEKLDINLCLANKLNLFVSLRNRHSNENNTLQTL